MEEIISETTISVCKKTKRSFWANGAKVKQSRNTDAGMRMVAVVYKQNGKIKSRTEYRQGDK